MTTLLRNSAFNLGSYAAGTLTALVCIPITFRQLGAERFGLLMLIWGMLSYAIVFDFGTGPAVARATAASLVRDGGRRIAALFRAGVMMQLVLGVVGALLIVLLAPVLLELLSVPRIFRADARLALSAVALTLPIVLIGQSQQAVLEGLERFDLLAYVRVPVGVATYAIPAAGALLGWSLATMMFALFASRVLAGIGFHALYRNSLPDRQEGSSRAELPALFRYGRWLAVSGALTQLLQYVDRYLLSALHGLGAVAQYAAPYDAATKLLILPGSIGVAMFPGLAKDAARTETDAAIARSRVAGRMAIIVLLPVCVILFAFAGPILHMWLGPQLSDQGVAAFRVLLIAMLLHAMAYPPVIMIEAFGRSDVVARYYLVECAAYVPIAVLAIWQFGIAGAAWVWVARTVALLTWSTWYARRWLHAAQPATITEFADAN